MDTDIMKNPAVSFIVPCYKLAHLLAECVNSILAQSFDDLEILIMDDCSPDNTAEVAQSFHDPRVKYIRNDPNLGHLQNYNKGISLARGRYIWLISADDCLRRPYVLERYVETLDANPSVGYAWCPGVGLKNGQEVGSLQYSVYADHDLVIRGHDFLTRLLKVNFVPAPSGMVRRECYDLHGGFPLDMPWAGDWYLWCLFALHFDVAYFAEPMVCYREHDLSMTNALMNKSVAACCEEDVKIVWNIKMQADIAGFHGVSKDSLSALGHIYGRSMSSGRFQNSESVMTWQQFEESLDYHSAQENEKIAIISQVCCVMADEYYAKGDIKLAKQYYQRCLHYYPWNNKALIKVFLLSFGSLGHKLRKSVSSIKGKAH